MFNTTFSFGNLAQLTKCDQPPPSSHILMYGYATDETNSLPSHNLSIWIDEMCN